MLKFRVYIKDNSNDGLKRVYRRNLSPKVLDGDELDIFERIKLKVMTK